MQVFHSNYQPFVFDQAADSFQLVDQIENGKKCYYQIKNSHLSLAERIGRISLAVYKIISNVFSWSLALSSDTKAYWREGIFGKKEIVVVTANPTGLTFPRQCSQYDLSHFIYYASQLTRANNEDNARLHLHQVNLSALSDSIGYLANLRKLSLSYMPVQSLPGGIGQLAALEKLDIFKTKLYEFPESICHLTNLAELALACNDLRSIPDAIDHLANLKKLDLKENWLEELPESIGGLANLQCLCLEDNQLQALSRSIGRLANLEELELSGNRISEIPEEIGQLSSLKKLIMQRNQLQTVPVSLGRLANLKLLDLADNRIAGLPAEISQLLKLKELIVEGNELQIVPASVGQLAALEKLKLRNNQIPELPDSMGHLAKLQYLDLSCNRLQGIPHSFNQLACLRTLYLHGNHFQAIPSALTHLVNLRELSLSENRIEEIPDTIGQLANLRYLYFMHNQLQELPDSIGHLSKLSYLDLSHNRFQAIPECLYRLPSSCRVFIEGNPLSEQTIEQARARMQERNYQGPQIIFSVEEWRREQRAGLNAVLMNWCNSRCRKELLGRLPSEQKPVLLDWLARLQETASYRSHTQAFKGKVRGLLRWMAEEADEDKLQMAYQIMANAASTCMDSVEWSYNALCLHARICQSGNLSLQELKALIIGAERYDRLNRIAEKKCQQMRLLDPIAVHLAYEIKLKEELQLPTEAMGMLYEYLAEVTTADIEAAKAQILAETGPDKQGELLLEHPVWKAALQKCDGFAEIEQACRRQKAEALRQLEDSDSAAEQFHQTFQEKEKTVWNPHYVLTQRILRDEEAA